MKRLNKKNVNTPELSWDIFEKRWRKQLQYIDFRRYKLLEKYFEKGRYLDLGVFNSPLPAELKRRKPDAEVWGLDYAERVINYLKAIFPEMDKPAACPMAAASAIPNSKCLSGYFFLKGSPEAPRDESHEI